MNRDRDKQDCLAPWHRREELQNINIHKFVDSLVILLHCFKKKSAKKTPKGQMYLQCLQIGKKPKYTISNVSDSVVP